MIVERRGRTAAGERGVVDVGHRRFERVTWQLLPHGPAWPRDDEVLGSMVQAGAREPSRVHVRGRKLLRELDPRTAFLTLEDWEASYRLPDCAPVDGVAARRKAIMAKIVRQAGTTQDAPFWADLMAQLEYELLWQHGPHYPCKCIDPCICPVNDDAWVFVSKHMMQQGASDALVECVVSQHAWIGLVVGVGWLWQDVVLPAGPGWLGVACDPDGYLVAVGDLGVRHMSANGGLTWTAAAPAAGALLAVCVVPGVEVVIAVGEEAGAVRSVDHGATWSVIAFASVGRLRAVVASPGGAAVVAAGHLGETWRSVDLGLTWGPLANASQTVWAMTRCTGAMVCGGAAGLVRRSVDNGATWSEASVGVGDWYGAAGWLTTVILCGDGAVARSEDAGVTWTSVAVPGQWRSITGRSPRWVVAGIAGAVALSTDDGATWAVHDTAGPALRAAAYHPETNRVVVVGDGPSVLLEH